MCGNTEFYMAVRYFQRMCFSVFLKPLEIGSTVSEKWYYWRAVILKYFCGMPFPDNAFFWFGLLIYGVV